MAGTRTAGRLAFAAALVLSLVVLFTPASGVPTGLPVNDKVVHGTLFAILALTGRWARLPALPLGLALTAYAGVSEVLQTVLPIHRDGDWRDAATDVLGAIAGLGAAALARRRWSGLG